MLKKAIKYDKTNALYHHFAGLHLLKMEKYSQAVYHLQKAVDLYSGDKGSAEFKQYEKDVEAAKESYQSKGAWFS